VFIRIDKHIIGESTRNNIAYRYTRLFQDFPPRTVLDGFTEFEVPSRELPRIFTVGTDSLTKQQAVAVPDHYSNTDMRPLVHPDTRCNE
jgi:hypothetical protein